MLLLLLRPQVRIADLYFVSVSVFFLLFILSSTPEQQQSNGGFCVSFNTWTSLRLTERPWNNAVPREMLPATRTSHWLRSTSDVCLRVSLSTKVNYVLTNMQDSHDRLIWKSTVFCEKTVTRKHFCGPYINHWRSFEPSAGQIIYKLEQ